MGLSITFWKNLKPVSKDLQAEISASDEPSERAYDIGATMFRSNPGFPGRFDGLRDGVAYTGEKCGSFQRGYMGYMAWRSTLARIVGIQDLRSWWKDPKPGPFYELLNFSDCEGAIGPIACKKLANDFAEWLDAAKAADHGGLIYFMDGYMDMLEGFNGASYNGCADFH